MLDTTVIEQGRVIKKIWIASLACLVIANVSAQEETDSTQVQLSEHVYVEPSEFIYPSLSATYVSWHEPSGQEITRATIEMSPGGLRVREGGSNSKNEMLQDFIGERIWIIDHERSIGHNIGTVDTSEEQQSDTVGFASFLGPNPCGVLEAQSQGPGVWRGRQVTAFHCTNPSGEVLVVEFIDAVYKIVVFSRTHDGFADELRGLSDRVFNESHFVPPANYRAVDKREFFFGAPALLPYEQPVD